MHIRLDKIDGFIRVCYRTKYLVLFGLMMSLTIRLDSLLVEKSSATCVFSHNNAKMKIDSYNLLPLEKTLTLHNFIIFTKSVFHKDQNHYYYNIFLEKYSYR